MPDGITDLRGTAETTYTEEPESIDTVLYLCREGCIIIIETDQGNGGGRRESTLQHI